MLTPVSRTSLVLLAPFEFGSLLLSFLPGHTRILGKRAQRYDFPLTQLTTRRFGDITMTTLVNPFTSSNYQSAKSYMHVST